MSVCQITRATDLLGLARKTACRCYHKRFSLMGRVAARYQQYERRFAASKQGPRVSTRVVDNKSCWTVAET